MRHPDGPGRSSRLIEFAARLVPADAREAWLKEHTSALWREYFALQRDGVPEEQLDRALLPFCAATAQHAVVLRLRSMQGFVAPSRLLANPRHVLSGIAALVVALLCLTAGMRHSREALRGLPYPESEQLVMLRRTAMVLGMNASPSVRLGEKWAAAPTPSVRVAAFAWSADAPAADPVLLVSDNLFDILRMNPALGKPFSRAATLPEIILTHRTWRSAYASRSDIIGKVIDTASGRRVVAGVMPSGFWFLGRPVAAIERLATASAPAYVNAIGRLTDVSKRAAAEKELADVGRRKFIVRVEATFLQERVRRPLVVAAIATAAMILLALLFAFARRMFPGDRSRPSPWFTTYFVAKVAGLAIAVSLVWAEIVTGMRIAENGALQMSALVLMILLASAHIAVFAWAYVDQEKRCRTCCLPVAQPVTFGTWSSTLLDQPAVEFLCPNGHGSLFEPELNAGPGERPTWTSFDESWRT